ncbi:MAG: hypothetical protein WBJ87_01630 [Candidatus Hydrothermia bacterium]
MKVFIAFIFTLTNFHSVYSFGDPLPALHLSQMESFDRYFVSIDVNGAFVREYRYEYLYDSYDNTVGKQITYDNRNYYLLRPNLELGISRGRMKGFIYYKGVSDFNYRYEKIVYTPGYVPQDTLRIERKGDIYAVGLRASLDFGNFTVGGGLALLNKTVVSTETRTLSPEVLFCYRGRHEGVGGSVSPKVKFSEESDYSIPDKISLFTYYQPPSRTLAKFEFSFYYLNFSGLEDTLEDYYKGQLSVTHTFRDRTTLKMGGLLEKGFEGNCYAPGFEIGLGYLLDPFELGVRFNETFYNYYRDGMLIEESPLKVDVYFRVLK